MLLLALAYLSFDITKLPPVAIAPNSFLPMGGFPHLKYSLFSQLALFINESYPLTTSLTLAINKLIHSDAL